MGVYGEKAYQLFLQGYNCAQSLFCAFYDEVGLDEKTARSFSSSFGGGMGRLREVCGALSGAFMVLGLKYGDYPPEDQEAKARHYRRIQEFAALFREQNDAILCRELLGLRQGADDPTPEKRSEAYYQKRPCPRIVANTADLLAEYLQKEDAKK